MIATQSMEPRALRYQQHRGLDAVPGYATGMQVVLNGGRRVYLALSDTELVLYFDSEMAVHYDLEGRLVKVANHNEYWRRSLSNRGLHSRKRSRVEGGGIERQVLAPDKVDTLVRSARAQVGAVRDQLLAGAAVVELRRHTSLEGLDHIAQVLDRASQFDVTAARREAARFQRVYGRVAVLPPDEYNALVLQATEGCAYNGCLFCDLYKGVRFRAKSAAAFQRHIQEVVAFHGTGLRSRRSIFLGEANALTLPQRTVETMLQVVNERFELPKSDEPHTPASWWMGSEKRFDGIASFLDVFTGKPRSAAEFRQLRSLGLRRVYIGMESGDDQLLKWLRKPASAAAMIRCVRDLKEAGLAVGLMVLIGPGGRLFAAQHVRETARVLNELPLGRGDYIYFSPLLADPGGSYASRTAADEIEPLTSSQIIGQENALRAALRFDENRGRPYMARYPLEDFVY